MKQNINWNWVKQLWGKRKRNESLNYNNTTIDKKKKLPEENYIKNQIISNRNIKN